MNNSLLTRRASPQDLPELRYICIEAYSRNFGHHWNEGGLEWYLDQEFSLDRLEKDLTSSTTEYHFILKNHRPIGFFKLNIDPQFNTLELEKIYILPDQKGDGIGTKAMQAILRIAQQHGSKALLLYVIDTNEPAIQFYEKNGFVKMQKSRLDLPYFKEDLKGAWQMVKPL